MTNTITLPRAQCSSGGGINTPQIIRGSVLELVTGRRSPCSMNDNCCENELTRGAMGKLRRAPRSESPTACSNATAGTSPVSAHPTLTAPPLDRGAGDAVATRTGLFVGALVVGLVDGWRDGCADGAAVGAWVVIHKTSLYKIY